MKNNRFVQEVKEPVFIRNSQAAGQYLLNSIFVPFEQFEQEELWVFLLNARQRMTHQVMVYRGTVNSIEVRQTELFRLAVRLSAWGLLFAHNHPSGVATPSENDVLIYRNSRQVGELLNIEVIDHLVVGRDAWTSLHEMR